MLKRIKGIFKRNNGPAEVDPFTVLPSCMGIYWNNHHHMLHTSHRVTGPILWANPHLLFWLSLFPFATGWMGENHFAAAPSAFYGGVLLMAAVAYWVLQQLLIASQGPDSLLKKAVGSDWKGKVSPLIYLIAIPTAYWALPRSIRTGCPGLACSGSTYREGSCRQRNINPQHRGGPRYRIEFSGLLACPWIGVVPGELFDFI